MRAFKTACLLSVFGLTAVVLAWSSPKIVHVCNSAPDPGGVITVNVDVLGPFTYTDMMSAKVFYSTNNQASWTEVAMSLIGTPGYDSTYEASFPVPSSGTVFYYVRAKDTFGFATQTPYNANNTWPAPVNLLGKIADETSGDMINSPDGPFLDLTSIRMGYSSTHFYARMTNNDDDWPIGNIITDWYLYAAGFRNPDAPQDTFLFVMAYGNILGIHTPGLYWINGYTEEFERFADMDYVTDGNVLNMRCLISDLVNHPKFGPWPNPSGFLRAARGDTRSVDWQSNAALHDTTNQSRLYVDRSPKVTVGQNAAPTLMLPGVLPDTGTSTTNFRFTVDYTDTDTNLPILHAVVVDSDTFDLVPNGHRYERNVLFSTIRTGFTPGWHGFWFRFDDGMAVATSALDSFFVTGVGLAELPGEPVEEFAAAPVPFRDRVRFSVPRAWQGIRIHAPDGRLLRSLGASISTWDGRDTDGRLVPAGVYFVTPVARLRHACRRILRLGD